MKKFFATLLALVMMAASAAALAQGDNDLLQLMDEDGVAEGPQYTPISSGDFGDFVVAATTTLSGCFFTDMWGNNTCDIDVRTLLHSYSTVVWSTQPTYIVNPIVVSGIKAETNEDGNKVYTIQIYNDLTYNDGSPITARDYVFSILMQSAPQVAAIDGTINNMDHLAGWDAFSGGQSEVFSGVRLLNDYTFSMEIKEEYLPFFYELSLVDVTPYPIQVIAPGCEVADDGQGAYIRNTDSSITEPIFTVALLNETIIDPETGYLSHPYVTSGPWELVSFDWDTRELRARINPNFKGNWDGQKPVIDNIVFRSILPGEMIGALEDGSVHLLNKVVSGADIAEGLDLTVSGAFYTVNYSRIGFGFINFSCESGPMQFQAVRQVMAYAIDVDAFVSDYTMGYGTPVYGYYGIGQWMVLMVSDMGTEEMAENTGDMSEETKAAWEALSLDDLNHYDVNLELAEQLLIDDGWTLNEQGQPYEKGVDTVRCKMVDGKLMALRLKFGKMQDSVAAQLLEDQIRGPLAEIGIVIESTTVPFQELLEHYYRQNERTYDFMYLATNFISAFDPYFVFNTEEDYQGHQNTSGLRDAELEAYALELRQTQPGAYLEYCQKWMKFQLSFNEKLPMLPLYSNIYYDFFTDKLQNYHPETENQTWPIALLYAELGE